MHIKRKIISIILIIISLCFVVVPCFAKTESELREEKNNIQNKVDKVNKEKIKIRAEKDEVLNEILELEDKINEYEEDLKELKSKINKLESEIENKEKEIDKLQKEYDEMQQLLTDRLVAIYQEGQITMLDVFLSAESFWDFISLPTMIRELTESDNAQMDKVEKQRQKVLKSKKELEEQKAELNNSKKTVESKKGQLKLAKISKEEKAKNLTEEQAKLGKSINDYKEAIRELDAQIAEAVRNAENHFNETTPGGSGILSWPLPYRAPITSPFGRRRQPVPGASTYHRGIDIGVPVGTRVLAAADGYVMSKGYNIYRGNYVMVKHANNLYTFYQHLNSVSVSTGQNVSRGQTVAYSGCTGIGSGPHLHFEVRTGPYYGDEVDPMNYL